MGSVKCKLLRGLEAEKDRNETLKLPLGSSTVTPAHQELNSRDVLFVPK